MGVQAFGLDKNLVRIFAGKAVHLVFDGRTIAWADAFDHTGIHRRTVQAAANDFVRARVGMRDMAIDLTRMLGGLAEIGKHRHGIIAGLRLHDTVIEAAAVDARRRAGLQTIDAQRQFAQALCERVGRRIAGTAAFVIRQADMNESAEEGAGGQHHAGRCKTQTHLRHHTGDALAFDNQIADRLLEDAQIRLVLQRGAHRALV